MRFGSLFVALAAGALVIVSITPEPAEGCHWFGRGRSAGYGYGGAPMYNPAPAAAYPVAPGTSYPAPGPYYTPGPMPIPGTGPRPMPAPAPTTGASVSMKDNSFDPATLNVQVGTTVKWTNNGANRHTVTASDGKWDSGEIAPGGTYSVTFSTPGTYKYYCKLHKGMEGTIVVGEPGKAPVGGGTGSKY
jgi:plastocyanin